jgi:hypothetical protein
MRALLERDFGSGVCIALSSVSLKQKIRQQKNYCEGLQIQGVVLYSDAVETMGGIAYSFVMRSPGFGRSTHPENLDAASASSISSSTASSSF